MQRDFNNLDNTVRSANFAAVVCDAAQASRSRIIRRNARGFTLLELMIVISIIMILMAIAVPIYNQSVTRSKEAVLRQDLFTLRNVIDQYTLDKQKAPQGLDDLKQGNYIREIPKDPMTGEANWEVNSEDVLMSVDQTEPGIDNVHSASTATSLDGTPYNTW